MKMLSQTSIVFWSLPTPYPDLAVIATHYSERFEVEVDEICH